MFNEAYYLVENGPVLEAAEKFRRDYVQWWKDRRKTLKKYKIDGYKTNWSGEVYAVHFERGEKIPEGFKKPDKHGCVQPYKKNEEWNKILSDLGKQPQPEDYVSELINAPHIMSYTDDEGDIEGSQRIDLPFNPYQILFFDQTEGAPLCIIMGDAEGAIKSKQAEGFRITNEDALIWKPPEGIKRILKERWDLMTAEHEQNVQ